MRAVSRLLTGALGGDGVGTLDGALVSEARALTGVSSAALLELREAGVALRAAEPPATEARTLALDELGALRTALDRQAPVALDGVAARSLARTLALAVTAEAALLVPARNGRHALLLADESAERVEALDIEAAAAFASAAGISLDQAGVVARHAAQTERQAALARAAKALNESLDLGRVLPRICEEAAAILDADRVHVYRGGTPAALVLEASNAASERIGERIDPGAAVAARAVSLDRPLLSENGEEGVRSALAAPMRWDGQLRGVLWVGNRGDRALGEDDLALLESFAELAAVACRNASVHANLAEAARTDALTGCLNHAALQDTLRRELQRSRRRVS